MRKLFIFDLDGTLLNSIEDIADAMNEVFKSRSMPEPILPEYEAAVGAGLRQLIEDLLPGHPLDEEFLSELSVDFHSAYEKVWNKKSKLYDGIAELLDSLKSRDYPLAILSNKPHNFTEEIDRHYFQEFSFFPVFGSREGIPNKPDPGTAIEIAEHYNIHPENCFFIGDTEVDILTAKKAGMQSIAVSWGFRPIEAMQKEKPDYIIDHPLDLLQIIDEKGDSGSR